MAGETMYFVTGTDSEGRPLGIVTVSEGVDGDVFLEVNSQAVMRLEDGCFYLQATPEEERIPGMVYDEQGFPVIVREDV